MPRDAYEVLGLGRDADDTQIKQAWRRVARELHPDVNGHDPDAEEKFKEAAGAYEILKDAERRQIYDRHGYDGLRKGGQAPNFDGFGSISDLFNAFFGGGGGFGGGGAGSRAGDDASVSVQIELEQAASGAQIEISFEAVERCSVCRGNGAKPGTPISTCSRCGGNGLLQSVTRTPFGQMARTVACDVCAGEGKIPERPCDNCDGRGREIVTRTLKVDLPAGIDEGQRIRLSGRGHAGQGSAAPGDLYVLVSVKRHEHFLRDEHDLVTVLDVPAPLAALGATLSVPTLEGVEEVEIAPGTQPGQTINLRGRGMPQLRSPSRRGNLRVVVNVVIPRKLSDEQRGLLQQLAASITDANLRSDESLRSKLKRLLGV